METRAHHVLIGLVTVLVVAGAMLFGLWLAKSSVDSTFKDYEVVFNEAVTGLSKGSAVQYSGIKVGDVISLRLDPNDPRRVLAQIRLSAETPIKQDTQAKLTLTGVTGTSLIQLSGGTPQSPPLEGKGGRLPVIVASPSPIARLLNNSSDLVTNINLLLHNANRLFSEENATRLGATLANLEQTTGAIAGQRDDIRLAIQQMAQVGKQAGAALEQTSQLMRNANSLLGSDGKQIVNSADQAMQSLARSTATIDALLTDNREAITSGAQGFNELAPAIRELRDTLTALKGISQRLEANPSGYLLGRDKNKEFTP
ncbi:MULTISPECIES: MlaD family protein [Pseudomonas]|jgi:phospholipid/cholesterol/gamma-HCH transport system substrate-binding protein|uniref:Phospholipid/cholesterol/gamma-HCH transport system substrate-binding protein n=3 Tax=cellular organisms TaxID=131567 RepID=A0A9X8ED52_PSEPU|nr:MULTISPECIES: MlaD family protein [Pseudomonas]KIU50260.1 ABC transporter permease [Pseudomonas putida]KTC17777.1 ABC transporter permease [Pseudomonas putida]MBG8562654.1 MCE family protein [Pseudomonas qingdaonensis]MCO7505212.1 MCE family protein [Pseudomonas sp. VE 267-6A]MCO7529730.1 MCE family protein [Pseudomonas sp. 2]